MVKGYKLENNLNGMPPSNMFRCVVEDNKDPEYLGRVKLRVIGVHDAIKAYISTEDLPWSRVLNPIDAGNTLGSSTNVLQGTWGYCMCLDNNFTEFLLMGTVKGTFKEKPATTDALGNEIGFNDPDGRFPTRLNEPDNPLTYGKAQVPDITQPRVKVDTFEEPVDTAHNAKYPNNKVYEDHNGNVVEIDGTDGNSRIRIQHSTGARVEINNKGDVTIQGSKTGNVYIDTPGLFAIGADGNLILDGDLKVTGSIESGGDVSDIMGNLSSLRDTFDSHTHPYNAGSTPATTPAPTTPDPKVKFIWSGSPV